ncbi:hypothetical protein GCM10025789_08370 [Tessaracoccus lubricantis]|uniref:PLD phosphodiesterase domain-containing protein n=1 Tax=Tessaracoccus lubricantis TaxID=545543 RepID=A0ABP9F4V3_9ACTN
MSHELRHLGDTLTGTEAGDLATAVSAGRTLTQALQLVQASRRAAVRQAVEEATSAMGAQDPAQLSALLYGIQGAKSRPTEVLPQWTLPGYLADYGDLTSSVGELVRSARSAVTCSTFNFQRSSVLWEALREVAQRGSVSVRVYLDAGAAASNPWTPSATEVAEQLPGAKVFRTTERDGKLVVNHAKFVAVDHQFLIVTSANMSMSAERSNIELGLRVHSEALCEAVEKQLLSAESVLYELMPPSVQTTS